MAKLESFIQIEEAVQRSLGSVWVNHADPIMRKITAAAKRGETQEADLLVDQLTFEVLQEVGGRVEFLFDIAVMFGAGQLTEEGRTVFDETGMPDMPARALDSMLRGFEVSSIEHVRRLVTEGLADIEQTIHEEQQAVKEEQGDLIKLKKQSISEIADRLNDAVIGTGKGLLDVGANLSTSRLVSFGFLSEASARGIDTYSITEQLDRRTCPVCRRMHGQTFRVERPIVRIVEQLTTVNVEDLKSAWPFPRASKAGLRELEELTNDDLQAKGWDTPPFHPACRGVLQRTGSVEPLPIGDRQLADPRSGLLPVIPVEEGLASAPALVSGEITQTGAGALTKARTFSDPDDYDKWGKLNAVSLTDAEAEGLRRYTTAARTINDSLRVTPSGVELPLEVINLIPDIDRLVAKAVVPENITVYRGVEAEVAAALFGDDLTKVVGAEIIDKAYMSTTAVKDWSAAFAKARSGESAVVLEIVVPKGSSALHVGSSIEATFAGELEFLLPRGTRLRVVGVERNAARGLDQKTLNFVDEAAHIIRVEVVQ